MLDHQETITLRGRSITIAPLSWGVIKRVVFPALKNIDTRDPEKMLDGLVQMIVEAAKTGGTVITAEEVEDLLDFVSFEAVLSAVLSNSGLKKKVLAQAETADTGNPTGIPSSPM